MAVVLPPEILENGRALCLELFNSDNIAFLMAVPAIFLASRAYRFFAAPRVLEITPRRLVDDTE